MDSKIKGILFGTAGALCVYDLVGFVDGWVWCFWPQKALPLNKTQAAVDLGWVFPVLDGRGGLLPTLLGIMIQLAAFYAFAWGFWTLCEVFPAIIERARAAAFVMATLLFLLRFHDRVATLLHSYRSSTGTENFVMSLDVAVCVLMCLGVGTSICLLRPLLRTD